MNMPGKHGIIEKGEKIMKMKHIHIGGQFGKSILLPVCRFLYTDPGGFRAVLLKSFYPLIFLSMAERVPLYLLASARDDIPGDDPEYEDFGMDEDTIEKIGGPRNGSRK